VDAFNAALEACVHRGASSATHRPTDPGALDPSQAPYSRSVPVPSSRAQSPSSEQSPSSPPQPLSSEEQARGAPGRILEATCDLLTAQATAQAEAHDLQSVRRVMLCGLRLADRYPQRWGALYARALEVVQAAVRREYQGAALMLRR